MIWFAPRAFSVAGLAATAVILRTLYTQFRIIANEFRASPASELSTKPDSVGIPLLREIFLRSADGLRLAGWYVPSRNRAAVVVTHGTNADRASMLDEVRILADAGFGVLTFDWPGEGRSDGRVRWSASERLALTAAVNWLASCPEVDAHRIGGLGFSKGAYLMAQVAAQDRRLRAVLLAAAPPDFAEYARWVNRRLGFLSWLPSMWALRRAGMQAGESRPLDVIGDISPRPILLLGGGTDEVVPESMTRRLFAAAREPKSLWIIPDAGHGGYAGLTPEYATQLVQFFGHSLTEPESSGG